MEKALPTIQTSFDSCWLAYAAPWLGLASMNLGGMLAPLFGKLVFAKLLAGIGPLILVIGTPLAGIFLLASLLMSRWEDKSKLTRLIVGSIYTFVGVAYWIIAFNFELS